MDAIATYVLASTFVNDHWQRDLPEAASAISRKIRDSGARVVAELDRVGYDELLSDASYYATEMGAAGCDETALLRSAERVVAALKKVGPPVEEEVAV